MFLLHIGTNKISTRYSNCSKICWKKIQKHVHVSIHGISCRIHISASQTLLLSSFSQLFYPNACSTLEHYKASLLQNTKIKCVTSKHKSQYNVYAYNDISCKSDMFLLSNAVCGLRLRDKKLPRFNKETYKSKG